MAVNGGGGFDAQHVAFFLKSATTETEKQIISLLADLTCTLTRTKARQTLQGLKNRGVLVSTESVLGMLEYMLVHREIPLKDRQFIVFEVCVCVDCSFFCFFFLLLFLPPLPLHYCTPIWRDPQSLPVFLRLRYVCV